MENKTTHHFFRAGFIYLGLSLSFFILHLISVSVISFFHFQLEHPLAIIEDWISSNSWFIFTFLKICLVWIFLKFYISNTGYPLDKKQFLGFVMGKTRPTALLIIFYYWVYYLVINSMQFIGDANFELWSFVRSYLSTSVLFLYFALIGSLLLQNLQTEKSFKQLFFLSFFLLIEYVLISFTFIYIASFNVFLVFGFIIIIPILVWNGLKLLNICWIVLLGIAPLAVLSGQGLFLDVKSQLFSIREPMSFHLHLTFMSILLTYLVIKDSKRVFFPPKIKRHFPDHSK